MTPYAKKLMGCVKSDPEWSEAFGRNIDKATKAANIAPLVHVMGDKGEGGAAFKIESVFTVSEPSIPLSSDRSYCSEKTRLAEKFAGYDACVYFYAGDANEAFGSIAFAFDHQFENGRIGSASPFDSGRLYWRKLDGDWPDRANNCEEKSPPIVLVRAENLPLKELFNVYDLHETIKASLGIDVEEGKYIHRIIPDVEPGKMVLLLVKPNEKELKKYLQHTTHAPIPPASHGESWRESFKAFLAAIFDDVMEYFSDKRPGRSLEFGVSFEPERNRSKDAWTTEVRLHGDVTVFDCQKWAADHSTALSIQTAFVERKASEMEYSKDSRWGRFWERRLKPAPSNAVREMNDWVYKYVEDELASVSGS